MTSTLPLAVEDATHTWVAVDAMGGDLGPAAVVGGMALAARDHADLRFLVHGDEAQLAPLIQKRKISHICEIKHADGVVSMDDKPSQVMRHGKGTSMWSAISSVKSQDAQVCVSCGNTGALMAVSMVRLRKAPGVNRPAIAILWPSRGETGFSVMLDVGADIRADETDLLQYALMGTSYARNGLGITMPKVGLLNVGTEEHKGKAELKVANTLLAEAAEKGNYHYCGFVEGSDIPSEAVDVIVTDGFTGNIALKTAEGTASLIRDTLRDSFKYSVLSKLAGLIAYPPLRRLSQRIDPRRVNGGVFLGLNGTVVKSHGSADATGVAAAIGLAYRLTKVKFTSKLAARVASAAEFPDDDEEG